MLPHGKYLRMNYFSLVLIIIHVMEILGLSRYFPVVVKELKHPGLPVNYVSLRLISWMITWVWRSSMIMTYSLELRRGK